MCVIKNSTSFSRFLNTTGTSTHTPTYSHNHHHQRPRTLVTNDLFLFELCDLLTTSGLFYSQNGFFFYFFSFLPDLRYSWQTTKFAPAITRTLFRHGPERSGFPPLSQDQPAEEKKNRNNRNLVVYFMPAAGKSSAQKLHSARFSGFRVVLKNIQSNSAIFSSRPQNTTQTHAQTLSVGKFCYQRSPNLCRRRRFRQLCTLQKCVSVKTVLYHHIIIHARFHPALPEVPLISPSSSVFSLQGWLVVLLSISRLFLAGPFSCSSSDRRCCVLVRLQQLDTTNTQSIQPQSCVLGLSTSLKNRNPGNNRPRSPHSWLKPATLVCQRHSLLLGEVPPGRPPANMDPLQSGPPPFTAPPIQQVFPKSTPTGSGRPTRVESTRFNSFPFGTRRPPGICVTTIRSTPSPAPLVEPFNFQQFRTHFFDNFGTINVPRPRIPGSPQKSGLATGPKPKIPSKNTL